MVIGYFGDNEKDFRITLRVDIEWRVAGVAAVEMLFHIVTSVEFATEHALLEVSFCRFVCRSVGVGGGFGRRG